MSKNSQQSFVIPSPKEIMKRLKDLEAKANECKSRGKPIRGIYFGEEIKSHIGSQEIMGCIPGNRTFVYCNHCETSYERSHNSREAKGYREIPYKTFTI